MKQICFPSIAERVFTSDFPFNIRPLSAKQVFTFGRVAGAYIDSSERRGSFENMALASSMDVYGNIQTTKAS
jgi:hypothetical protein